MSTELQRAAAHINTSTTGAIATVMDDHVSVEVPGILSLPGGRAQRIYTTEKVRTLRDAIRLVLSME